MILHFDSVKKISKCIVDYENFKQLKFFFWKKIWKLHGVDIYIRQFHLIFYNWKMLF